jgi:TPR repeat protein
MVLELKLINKKHPSNANLGNEVAQNNLTVMYEKGDGITKDVGKAICWYEQSAKQEFVLAKNNLKILQKRSIIYKPSTYIIF